MEIETAFINRDARLALLKEQESQFLDFKSKDVSPAKLTRILSALANADGGDVYVGIAERDRKFVWLGFENDEAANAHIQVVSEFFGIGNFVSLQFLESNTQRKSKVLKISVDRTPDTKKASDGKYYIRRGAQSLAQIREEDIERLKLNKGMLSHEDRPTDLSVDDILSSETLTQFSEEIVPHTSPAEFWKKQKLKKTGSVAVAGVLLFDDEPQSTLPKASIKIYRYNTSDDAGSRATLEDVPLSVEGPAIEQIKVAVETTASITEAIQVRRGGKLIKVEYPREAIHEIITNAVIHRDYSLSDNIHVRIFDNRVEIQSPGTLPGYVTVNNIRSERFSRNQRIVRLINKFPNPPNKDVGEGMNTAFEFMEKMRLKPPIVEEKDTSLIVTLRHEPLARPEILILAHLKENPEINNSVARELTGIGSENKVKNIFLKLIEDGLIEKVPGKRGNKTAYRISDKGRKEDTSAVE